MSAHACFLEEVKTPEDINLYKHQLSKEAIHALVLYHLGSVCKGRQWGCPETFMII